MVVDSIVGGNTGGRLWTLDPGDPGIFSLLWDQGNNRFYLAGQGTSPHIQPALHRTVQGQIREAASASGALHFGVRSLSPATERLLQEAFGRFLGGSREYLFFSYGADSIEFDCELAMEDAQLLPIDRALLEQSPMGCDVVKREIQWMWPSLERFLQKGWGWTAAVGGAIGCWCTAEYVGHRFCGIGIETAPELQNRGLATATAARFVSESLSRQCTPHWECGVDNAPSVRVAEKLGFEVLERTSFLIGRFE